MPELTPEPLDGGLVTARDPATLNSGELTLANNAYYLPHDPAIHKVKGRTKYNAVALGTAGNVKGLRYLEFDDSTAIVAAHESDDIHLSAFSAETGTFASLTPISNVGSGQSMDSVHYGNKHYLLIGAGQNQVVKTGGATRAQGMIPVPELTTAPTVTAGAWSTALGTGFFHFLVTEVIIDTLTGDELESAFTGTPLSVQITTVGSQQVTVTRSTLSNTLATNWRVYMAGPTTAETPIPLLSDFRLVAEQDIANTTVTVGNQALTAGRLPTANTTQVAGWATVSNVFSNTDNAGMTTATFPASEYLRTFGFSGISGTITGFEVAIRFKMTGFFPKVFGVGSNSPKLILDLTHNGTNFFPGNSTTYVLARLIQGVTNGYVTLIMGDPYNLWGRSSWALADVNANASFGIRLVYGEEYSGTNATLNVDWVKIAVHSTGSARPVNLEGRPFRVVTVAEAGIVTVYPADMPPPTASTGDIFEGQLILNDVQDTSMLRASLPDEVESFPGPYFVNFETKERDEITLVRRVGNKMVVALTHQLYRLNYFPRETDAEFDRGRCFEAISESHGIVGPMAGTLFSPDGGPLLLGYVSHDGLHATDAYQTKALNKDLDWRTTVTGSSLNTSMLVNFPILEQLWLYYTISGVNKALVFHYNTQHRREDGSFKVTGPVDVAAFSACLARLSGADVLLTGQSGGFVYVEDRGYDHNAGGTIPFSVQTREMYPGGYAGQITMNSMYVRHRGDSPTATVTVTPVTRTGSGAQVTQAVKTFTAANGGAAMLPWSHIFESLQVKLSEPGANGGGAVRLTALALELTGHGLPEART